MPPQKLRTESKTIEKKKDKLKLNIQELQKDQMKRKVPLKPRASAVLSTS